VVACALTLDWLLGEVRRFHPLVGFGTLATWIESRFNAPANKPPLPGKVRGAFALLLLLVPTTAIVVFMSAIPGVGDLLGVLLLYFSLGHKSLHQHARPVATALRIHDLDQARHLASNLVSRDASAMTNQSAIATAATESVLENGNDAVFAALFWFAIAGAPGVLLYRLANTLDAMWGYRHARYREFGWAAARFDDVLNLLPARLTALTYALLGKTRQALTCWRHQAPAWISPNAGPVMAAGAGALGIRLGGPACYRGEWHNRPVLGGGATPDADDIERALQLVRHGVLLWLALGTLGIVFLHA